MLKELGPAKLKGKDVDHKLSLKGGGSNARSNLRLRDPSANRGDKTFGPEPSSGHPGHRGVPWKRPR